MMPSPFCATEGRCQLEGICTTAYLSLKATSSERNSGLHLVRPIQPARVSILDQHIADTGAVADQVHAWFTIESASTEDFLPRQTISRLHVRDALEEDLVKSQATL